MKPKLKTTIITALLLMASVSFLAAQDKYEYATVKYVHPGMINKGLHVSVSGKEYEKIEISKDDIKDSFNDYTFVLNYIQKMTDNGWKIISTFNNADILSFVLERKKN